MVKSPHPCPASAIPLPLSESPDPVQSVCFCLFSGLSQTPVEYFLSFTSNENLHSNRSVLSAIS